MKLKKRYILGAVLLIAAGGLGRQAKPTQEPAPDAVAQHRRSFLEGVLFAARQRETMLLKPPVGFNTKDVLAGIETVEVIVEDLAPVVEKYGLAKKDLRAGIESQLRRRRIELMSPQPAKTASAENAQNAEQGEEPNEALMQLVNPTSAVKG